METGYSSTRVIPERTADGDVCNADMSSKRQIKGKTQSRDYIAWDGTLACRRSVSKLQLFFPLMLTIASLFFGIILPDWRDLPRLVKIRLVADLHTRSDRAGDPSITGGAGARLTVKC